MSGLGEHRLGGLDVVVGEFWRAPSGAVLGITAAASWILLGLLCIWTGLHMAARQGVADTLILLLLGLMYAGVGTLWAARAWRGAPTAEGRGDQAP